jgi:hypothetical protein
MYTDEEAFDDNLTFDEIYFFGYEWPNYRDISNRQTLPQLSCLGRKLCGGANS